MATYVLWKIIINKHNDIDNSKVCNISTPNKCTSNYLNPLNINTLTQYFDEIEEEISISSISIVHDNVKTTIKINKNNIDKKLNNSLVISYSLTTNDNSKEITKFTKF